MICEKGAEGDCGCLARKVVECQIGFVAVTCDCHYNTTQYNTLQYNTTQYNVIAKLNPLITRFLQLITLCCSFNLPQNQSIAKKLDNFLRSEYSKHFLDNVLRIRVFHLFCPWLNVSNKNLLSSFDGCWVKIVFYMILKVHWIDTDKIYDVWKWKLSLQTCLTG